jgi:uncharacterized protein HemX
VVEVKPGTAAILRDCDIPAGVTFRAYYGDTMDPVAEPETPPTEPVEAPTSPASEAPTDLPVGTPVLPSESQAQALSPSDTLDVSQVQALAGGDPMIMLAVLLVMVLGGGAGWKFWGQYSEQKHQQALERLRLERDMAGHGGASPPPCQTAHAELERKLAAIDKRLSDTTRKVGTVIRPDSPGVEELDERLTRAEKQIKALARDR